MVHDPEYPFQDLLKFFNDAGRQRRMEEAEIHHDRAPLAGVVRELEADPAINECLAGLDHQRTKRFRQAAGALVRMIMQRRGWHTTGRKGSLGVRAATANQTPTHNTGGLAFWFIRAERYEREEGMPFRSVRQRCRELATDVEPARRTGAAQRPASGSSLKTTPAIAGRRDRRSRKRQTVHLYRMPAKTHSNKSPTSGRHSN